VAKKKKSESHTPNKAGPAHVELYPLQTEADYEKVLLSIASAFVKNFPNMPAKQRDEQIYKYAVAEGIYEAYEFRLQK